MRTIKILTMAALCASSLTPVMISPAMALPADGDTTAAMAQTCAAMVNGSLTLHDGTTPVWSTEVIDVLESEDAPVNTDTEVPNTRAGFGSPSYTGLSIGAGPYRTGGSVNMFGDQVATTKTYNGGSTFKFDRHTAITTHYTFTCELTQKTETLVPGETIEGEPYYVNPGGGDCKGIKPNNPGWGADIGACEWTGTGTPDVVTEDTWVEGPDVVTNAPGQSAQQTDESDQYGLDGFDATPWVQPGGPWFVGQVVICISPGSKGGAWRVQNGYGGGSLVGPAAGCNTPYFKIAPWGGGSQTSNGTYISVPGY